MSKKVLIIEDERNVCELLAHMLIGNGFDATVAYTGKDGLRLSRSISPDVIILDILLPDINGFEVLQALKSAKETSSIPVLMCTEKNFLGDIEQAIKLGATGYITKPFDIQRVLNKVQDLVK